MVKSDVELKEGKLSMEGFEGLSNCGCIQILMGSEERASWRKRPSGNKKE